MTTFYLVTVIVSIVSGGYLGYRYGRYVQSKVSAAIAE